MTTATTIKQGQRLIAAGISPDTADMTWARAEKGYELQAGLLFAVKARLFSYRKGYAIPSWSLGALWDLCKKKGYCLEFNTKEDTSEGMIEHMVNILADPIIGIMDKVANNEI